VAVVALSQWLMPGADLAGPSSRAPSRRRIRRDQQADHAPDPSGRGVAEPARPRTTPRLAGARGLTRCASRIIGSAGTTVAEALEEGAELPRRVECLGHGTADCFSLRRIPGLRPWVGRKGSPAYHRGLVERLAAEPRETVLASAGEADAPPGRAEL
jgi:hypothetical protein